MDANATQVDALATAAEEGVDVDGLTVERRGDGYAFAVPGDSREGLSEAELREVADEHAEYVTNWYYWDRVVATGKDDRRAFLRWLEGADDRAVPERCDALRDGGTTRTWGQLSITARADADGLRSYDLRHVDDADAAVEDLERHDDPLDAREIVTLDERGRYRPLKTAPTLRSGWVFPDLDAPDLVTAVDYVYPATVANWHREREGELDVSHWRETAERQSGIYDIVEELDREAVERIAESCCVDSQCLKRREWEYDGDEGGELAVDGGDGEFPCREPCSLVIAAARQWTKLEREEPRTYEFELTPGEKEQIEEIIDAVAEGRTGEIREADVYEGANRYRARYLRAKRLDEEGRLGGVPTGGEGESEAEH